MTFCINLAGHLFWLDSTGFALLWFGFLINSAAVARAGEHL